MDFHTYTTMRDWTRRSMPEDRFADPADQFYKVAMRDAVETHSGQFLAQLINEQDWEKSRRPYYNLWPSIIGAGLENGRDFGLRDGLTGIAP